MITEGNQYYKKDIYDLFAVPEKSRKGSWDTGYRFYNGDIFIFSNVGIPGRTGHNYNNYWDGDLFVWQAKTTSHINQPLIQKMLHPAVNQKNYLFTRTHDKDPFTFEGLVEVNSYEESRPVKIIWRFSKSTNLTQINNNEIVGNLKEGRGYSVTLSKHERNPLARRICIEYYGYSCQVCSFNFYKIYGEIGKNYIHVHHRNPLASIKKIYVLVPEKDLIPLCPNCHSMIHNKTPILSVEELKEIYIANKNY